MLRFSIAVLSLILAISALAATASHADASRLVFVCGKNLCAVDPDTGKRSQITTDGAKTAYRFPSISRDGRRLAAARGTDVRVGAYGGNLNQRWASERDINAVALAPDGRAVAESHSYVQAVNRFRCYPFSGCNLELVLEDFSRTFYTQPATPEDITRGYRGGGGVGFLGNGSLITSYFQLESDEGPAHHGICVVASPAAEDQECATVIKHPESLTGLAGSPDSRMIAAAVGDPEPATTASIRIFNAQTGAQVRRLAGNGSRPVFSPDGRQVAYAGGDGWIHTVSTKGGKSRRLTKGHSPTWGGGGGVARPTVVVIAACCGDESE